MRRLTNSYTRFFNTKGKRNGPIFQGAFKAVHVSNDEQLVHVSRYLHINPVVSYVIDEVDMWDYPWTSLPEYIGDPKLVDPLTVLSHFSSKNDYRSFVSDQIGYGKSLESIKHLAIE
jgi:putative transposase